MPAMGGLKELSRSRWLEGMLAILLLGSFLYGLWPPEREADSRKQARTALAGQLFRIKTFSQEMFGPNGLPHSRLTAKEMHIEHRRLGIFRLLPMVQAVIMDAKVERFLESGPGSNVGLGLSALVSSLVRMSRLEMRSLRTAVVKGVQIAIYSGADSQEPSVRLIARRAIVDLQRGDVSFRDATMVDTRTGRQIEADRMEWDERLKKVLARGWYRARSNKGEARGRGLASDLGFNLSGISTLGRKQ